MSYPAGPLPREYRVTGTKPPTSQPVQSPPLKKASADVGIFGLSASTTFWILLAVHGGLISAEIYMAYKAGWIHW